MDPQDSDEVISDVHSENEYISEPYINPYTISKTILFWDVEDYPIPMDSDPVSIDKEIRSNFKDADYGGEVSIIAYIDKKKMLSEELRRKYCDAGITVNSIPEGYSLLSRVSPMLVDSYLWAIENDPPANMILLAKKVPERTMIAFQLFYWLGYAVVLSDPNNDEWKLIRRHHRFPPPLDKSCCFLKSLVDKKSFLRKDRRTKEKAIASAEITETLSPHWQSGHFAPSSLTAESKFRFFSNPKIANMNEPTLIVLVVEDWSKLPTVSELHETYKKVETALEDEGYDESFEQRIYIVDPKTDGSFAHVQNEYLQHEFSIMDCEGDREARFSQMLLDTMSWASVYFRRSERANVVLLSKKNNLGNGTKLYQVLHALFKYGFNVAIVNPDFLPEVVD